MMPLQVISGGKNLIAHLNENWNSKFLTEFEKNVLQPLGSIKSSSLKCHKEDILFVVGHGGKERSEIIPSTVASKDGVLIMVNACYFVNP